MDTVFEKLSNILCDIREICGTCVVWKRSALCITESRAAPFLCTTAVFAIISKRNTV